MDITGSNKKQQTRPRKNTLTLSREFEKQAAIDNRSSQKLNQVQQRKQHLLLLQYGLSYIMSVSCQCTNAATMEQSGKEKKRRTSQAWKLDGEYHFFKKGHLTVDKPHWNFFSSSAISTSLLCHNLLVIPHEKDSPDGKLSSNWEKRRNVMLKLKLSGCAISSAYLEQKSCGFSI